jgi:hypothetical protein
MPSVSEAPTQETAQDTAPIGHYFDFVKYLQRQRDWSERTFGPGARSQMVVDHARKELAEIEADPGDLREWIDLIMLALDGAWRTGAHLLEITSGLQSKLAINEGRDWPDWRTADPNRAIEHKRCDCDVGMCTHRTDCRGLQQKTQEGWTAERVDFLKAEWAKGSSAAEIAAQLPGFSRHAIIGKVTRLGLSHGSAPRTPRKARASGERAPKPAKIGVPYHLRRFETIKAGTDPGYVASDEPNHTPGIQFFELTNSTCRWPFGVPGAVDFCFCGRDGANLIEARPYCCEHARTA